jgi:cell division septum initiation protein DivIVA
MTQQNKKLKQKLLNKTLTAANKALEVAEDLVDMAQETAKSVVDTASDTARNTLQFTASGAQAIAQLAGGGAKITAQLASDTAKAATQLAQEAALQMAQNYFSKTTLTISLPESQLESVGGHSIQVSPEQESGANQRRSHDKNARHFRPGLADDFISRGICVWHKHCCHTNRNSIRTRLERVQGQRWAYFRAHY